MNDRTPGRRRRTRGLAASLLIASATASVLSAALVSSGCSGSNDNPNITPLTLATTCNQVCSNVLSECGVAASLYTTCTDACNALLLVPNTCITQFAGYLACLSGVTSITCVAEGQTFEITPGSCTEQEADYENCNTTGLSACLALSSSSTTCATNAGEGLTSNGTPEFCVGAAPDGCTATSSNPLGIGTYCCSN